MLLSIGFPAAGSSIIGFLLTAHPHIVMADEGELKTLLDNNIELLNRRNGIFYHLLRIDRFRYIFWKISPHENKMKNYRRGSLTEKRYAYVPSNIRGNFKKLQGGTREKRYVYVPGQYQGRFKKLQVIGNKRAQGNVDILANTSLLKHLRSKLEDNKISLKFIFNIRNLYDIFATYSQMFSDNKDFSVKALEKVCENNQKILEQIDSNDVFICKNEDLIANPKLQITRLCNFLNVPASVDYINACASRVIDKPTNSRLKIDWSDQHKQKINSLIKKYDFLYSYDC
ncbi:MAG: hypothetical protein GDA45_05235 [Chromatiales bacterium]|nr:hypothetical protein [Chromatiales bacterium]